ncbi:MAG: cell division protein FtsA [Armatimonadetes bacterium]|nr:cell division protein FtsA [Armatimonadota bacterium]
MSISPVFVLDLGSTKVVCLAASLTEKGDVRVEAFSQVGCRGVKQGVVHDVDATATAIDEAVSRVERSLGEAVDDLVVSIAGAHLQSVNAQGFVPIYPSSRQIRQDDVLSVINHSRQIVMPADREQIMAIPREFRIDGQRGVSKPIGMSGGRLEVVTHVVTGQSAKVSSVERAVTLAGRRVREMVPQPLATGLGVATMGQLEDGCVVVDIGGGTTDVAVFANGAIAYSGSVPVSSNHVTSDLSTLLKTSPDEAERLKTQFGACLSRVVSENERVEVKQTDQAEPRPMQRRVLCEIIESRMREIGTLVRRQIDMSGLNGQLPAGLLLTGGGSQMQAIDALFCEVLGVSKAAVVSPKVAGPHAKSVEVPTMSTSVGLARYCLESDEHEFAPVSGFTNWKEKIRTLRNPFNKKG